MCPINYILIENISSADLPELADFRKAIAAIPEGRRITSVRLPGLKDGKYWGDPKLSNTHESKTYSIGFGKLRTEKDIEWKNAVGIFNDKSINTFNEASGSAPVARFDKNYHRDK